MRLFIICPPHSNPRTGNVTLNYQTFKQKLTPIYEQEKPKLGNYKITEKQKLPPKLQNNGAMTSIDKSKRLLMLEIDQLGLNPIKVGGSDQR